MPAGCTFGLLFMLKVEAITSSETSVNISQNIRRHMQKTVLFTATIHTIRTRDGNDLATGTPGVCLDGLRKTDESQLEYSVLWYRFEADTSQI